MRISQRGSVLILIIVVMSVLSILGVAVLNASVSENNQTVYQEKNIEAYYAARSGAEAMASYLIGNSANTATVIGKTASAPALGSVGSHQFEVRVAGSPHPVTGKIIAPIIDSRVYETLSGVKTEVAKVRVQLLESTLFKGTVFADQYLSVGNNAGIMGDIGTNANTITFGGEDIDGDITFGPGATQATLDDAEANHVTAGHTAAKMTTPLVFPPILTSQFSTSWSGGTAFANTGISYYNIADLGGNTDYVLSGSGEIHLLVTNSISFNGNGRIYKSNPTDPVTLYLYYNGSDTVTLNGNVEQSCILYAPNATVNFNGGGNGTFTGAVVCKRFEGPSSHTNFYEDPAANMDHLMVAGVAGYYRGVYEK